MKVSVAASHKTINNRCPPTLTMRSESIHALYRALQSNHDELFVSFARRIIDMTQQALSATNWEGFDAILSGAPPRPIDTFDMPVDVWKCAGHVKSHTSRTGQVRAAVRRL